MGEWADVRDLLIIRVTRNMPASSDDDEVDFALLFVAQVAEFKAAEPEVVPAIDRFEQVAGDECFGALAGIIDARPIAQIWDQNRACSILVKAKIELD